MRLIDADVLVDGFEDNYEFCEALNNTPTVPAVPLSVIEKIKARINKIDGWMMPDEALRIIDQCIKECDT